MFFFQSVNPHFWLKITNEMEVLGNSSPLPCMKYVFFGLICFSILRNLYEMHELDNFLIGIQTSHPNPKTKSPSAFLLLNLTQNDMELVGKLKSEILPPLLGRYNFKRGETPFKEHVLERAVRQFKDLGVTNPEWGRSMYRSKYDTNPDIYCKKEYIIPSLLEYVHMEAYHEEVVRCGDDVISIIHGKSEHIGDSCEYMRKTLEDVGKPRGYFVEVGAGDGESRSPTICLEIEDKWTGLLIEADMRFWSDLTSKKRKVSLGLSCVGLTNRSYVGRFGIKEIARSKLIDKWDEGLSELAEVNCYPLYSYLLAVGRTDIDFLVVNINGQEVKVLQTLPWSRVNIHMIAVCFGTKRERVETTDYMAGKGYRLHRKYHQDGESFLMFVKQAKSG